MRLEEQILFISNNKSENFYQGLGVFKKALSWLQASVSPLEGEVLTGPDFVVNVQDHSK